MRFGIIGAGYIGPINTSALLEAQDVSVAAVANRTESKARDLCAGLGLDCPVYADWREMLRREKPDAVVISLYNDLHRECFTACARAGAHILVEKPLANTYADCLAMMEEAEKAGVRVSVLQTQRYNAVFVTARAYIDAHRAELGALHTINDHMSCNYFWAGRSPWHLDPVRSGGGIVLNYAVHQLDRIHWLMGQKTVELHSRCAVAKPGVNTQSSYSILGAGDGGTVYTAVCSGYAGPTVNEVTLAFANGTVRCNLADNGESSAGVYVTGADPNAFEKLPMIAENGPNAHAMYAREFAAAADYLAGRTAEPPVPLAWGAEMVRLCELTLKNQ